MRIIITSKGKNEIAIKQKKKMDKTKKLICYDYKPNNQLKNLRFSSNDTPRIKSNNKDINKSINSNSYNKETNNIKTEILPKINYNTTNTGNLKTDTDNLGFNSKERYNLKLKRIHLNKQDNDKYMKDENKPVIICKDLPKDIQSKNLTHLKIKEILKPSTIKNIKAKIIEEDKVKSNLYKLDENNFRTVFKPKIADDFRSKISKTISRENINIIKYLHNKEDLNYNLLEKLSLLDDKEINKINRICKIYFHYENSEIQNRNKIKEILKTMENEKKVSIKQSINKLESNLAEVEKILSTYKK